MILLFVMTSLTLYSLTALVFSVSNLEFYHAIRTLHILNNKLLRVLQQQAPLTPIYQLYNTFNTLPICINKKYWNWYIVQCFMIVIYQKCIVSIILLTNMCTVMTLGKVMICIFIISRNQLAKELFSILEVFCGILTTSS